MNRGKLYRDKEKWRNTCREQKRRYYGRTAIYPRRFWTIEEDKAILERNMTDAELSKILQRSIASIQMRRSKLRKFQTIEEV